MLFVGGIRSIVYFSVPYSALKS